MSPGDILRASPWMIGALILAAFVAISSPHMLGVGLWQLSKICIGAYFGYWIDRSMFPHGRPGDVIGDCVRHARYRRAIIIAACILAMGFGA